MPTIAEFRGITVRMYYRDHPPPHFHAFYGGYEALVSIADGRIIAGDIPPAVRSLLAIWPTRNIDGLEANWSRARNLEPLEKIES
jgi:hypothetical protein